MKLSRLRFSFPVMKIACTVAHGVPRKPTVFERALLELTERFSGDEDYREYNLEKVFGEILGVPEVDNFVRPSLEKLLAAGLLQFEGDLASLSAVRLQDLILTAEGTQMLQRGELPGELSFHPLKFFYDPLRRELVAAAESTGLEEKPAGVALHIDIEENFPESFIREEFARKPPEGITPESKIQRVVRDEVRLLWKTVEGEIHLSEKGEVGLLFNDEFYENYFLEMPGEQLYESVLAGLFDYEAGADGIPLSRDFPKLARSLAHLFPAKDLDLHIKLIPDTVHFLRYQDYLKDHLACKPNTLMVVFEHLAEDCPEGIEWDVAINGAIIYLDERFILEDCFYLNSRKDSLFVQYFQFKVNGIEYMLPLGYGLKKDDPQLDLGGYYELLEELLDISDDPDHQLIKLFWKPADAVLKDLERRIGDELDDPYQIGEKLTEYREVIRTLRPEM